MSGEQEARSAIVAAGRRLYERHILASIEGNMSVRLPDNRIVATPSGINKGFMQPGDMVVTDLEGVPRDPSAAGKPSSEIRMHLAIYKVRPDLQAIVHAHPTVATGYAVAGRQLPAAVLAEIVTTLGCIPIAPYGTPSTDELAEAVVGPIRNYDALLLANHGALTAGDSLHQAEERMYQLEHFAEVSLVAELLGGPKAFSIEEVERLSSLRERAGGRPVPPACYPVERSAETVTLTKDELVALMADAVRALR
ncbi:MAG: class II aldolase/adducin family protein [Acidobacteriota bacterium]|jgi:L-fuculose-phosphate aldolase